MERKKITFWCDRCRLDLHILASQHVKNEVAGLVWLAKCPKCKREVLRLVNNAKADPYFRRSRQRRAEARKHADAILQVGDARFDLLYPEHKRKKIEYEDKQHDKKNRDTDHVL